MPKVRITIDPDMCIGAASCVAAAPELFDLNDDSNAVLRGDDGESFERIGDMSPEVLERVLLAAQSCPVVAISLFDGRDVPLYPEF